MNLVTDANFWIDLYEGSLVQVAMQSGNGWFTTDLIAVEIEDEGRPQLDLVMDLGLNVETLDGSEVAEVTILSRVYPAPSTQDLSAIVLAKRMNTIIVTGDRQLRDASEREGLEVHGTLWVIDRLVRDRDVAPKAAAKSLQAMQTSDRRLPKGEVQRRINRWEAD